MPARHARTSPLPSPRPPRRARVREPPMVPSDLLLVLATALGRSSRPFGRLVSAHCSPATGWPAVYETVLNEDLRRPRRKKNIAAPPAIAASGKIGRAHV